MIAELSGKHFKFLFAHNGPQIATTPLHPPVRPSPSLCHVFICLPNLQPARLSLGVDGVGQPSLPSLPPAAGGQHHHRPWPPQPVAVPAERWHCAAEAHRQLLLPGDLQCLQCLQPGLPQEHCQDCLRCALCCWPAAGASPHSPCCAVAPSHALPGSPPPHTHTLPTPPSS